MIEARAERIGCHYCGEIQVAIVMFLPDGRCDRIHRCGTCRRIINGAVWRPVPWLAVVDRRPAFDVTSARARWVA